MEEKKTYGVKIHDGAQISPCVMMYQMGWENVIYTIRTGEVWAVGKNRYYFKLPKDFEVGDEIQITATNGSLRRWKRFRLVEVHKKSLVFEMTASDFNIQRKKNKLEELEKRIEALEGLTTSPHGGVEKVSIG